jgi:formylglycine-generating enzyme required for sulfatase activity
MHGNVWEWCEDDWHENYNGAPRDGSAWLSQEVQYKILRGGSFVTYPYNCRSAYRLDLNPRVYNFFFGFRVACELPRTS